MRAGGRGWVTSLFFSSSFLRASFFDSQPLVCRNSTHSRARSRACTRVCERERRDTHTAAGKKRRRGLFSQTTRQRVLLFSSCFSTTPGFFSRFGDRERNKRLSLSLSSFGVWGRGLWPFFFLLCENSSTPLLKKCYFSQRFWQGGPYFGFCVFYGLLRRRGGRPVGGRKRSGERGGWDEVLCGETRAPTPLPSAPLPAPPLSRLAPPWHADRRGRVTGDRERGRERGRAGLRTHARPRSAHTHAKAPHRFHAPPLDRPHQGAGLGYTPCARGCGGGGGEATPDATGLFFEGRQTPTQKVFLLGGAGGCAESSAAVRARGVAHAWSLRRGWGRGARAAGERRAVPRFSRRE